MGGFLAHEEALLSFTRSIYFSVPSGYTGYGCSADMRNISRVIEGRCPFREKEMVEKSASSGHSEIDTLILQALVRKLVAKGILSPDDVRALLSEAATRLNLVGSEQTPQAAHTMVEEDLAPAFLGAD